MPYWKKLEPGPRPPSSSGFDGSAITFTGSNVQVLPTPLQVSHAPYGLLNENERGSSCGMLVPSFGQASFSEYRRSAPSTTATITSPSAHLSAVCIEFSSRCSIPGLMTKRSMTTSIV